MTFTEVRQVTAADLVIEQILSMIQSGELVYGERLPSERNLAQMLGISRPTLREAISALAILDVLEIRQGSGTYVRAKSIDENLAYKAASLLHTENSHLDALEALILIEPGIAALAADRAEADDLASMQQALYAIGQRAESQSYFKKSGMDFHLALIRSIHNPVVEHACLVPLAVYYEGISEWWDVVKEKMAKPGRLSAYYGNYRRIFSAVEQGDATAARKATRKHLVQVRKDLLRS